MHKSATKCNKTIDKWCKNKHGASKIIDTFETYQPSDLKTAGVGLFSQIDFRYAAAIRNHDSEPETSFWHPAGTGIWRRSSSPSSPTSLHQPSMTPPSMCE
jgi:hypothetical protein